MKIIISFLTIININLYPVSENPKSINEYDRILQIALQKANTGNFKINASKWFNIATERIKILRVIENKLLDDLTDFSQSN